MDTLLKLSQHANPAVVFMPTSSNRNRRIRPALWLILLLLFAQMGASQDSSPDQPFVIATAPNVDENLFALRLLANVYARWPDLRGDRQQLSKWFANARSLTSSMRGQIAARQLDASLDLAYGTSLVYLSAVEDYLSALDVIDRQASAQNSLDILTSVIKSASVGSDVKAKASKYTSSEKSSDAAAMIGVASGLAQYAQLSAQRQSSTKAAIAGRERQLQDLWNTSNSTLHGVARSLSAKYGWAPGEAGFDDGRSIGISEMAALSPRDPFLKAQQADAVASTPNFTQLQQAAYLDLEAAQLVPSDAGYNVYRHSFVSQALAYATDAASLQAGSAGYSSLPSAGRYALKIARTYLAMYQDADGWGHVQLARALGFSGRFQEAIQSASSAYTANKQWLSDPYFCARTAALLSLTNQQDQVAPWLSQAFKYGYHDVVYLRQSQDFERFRYARATEFTALTAVRWRWTIVYGFLNDDVVIQNDSHFPLTNVIVDIQIVQAGQTMSPRIKCDSIVSGGSCKAVNIVSIHNDRYDDGAAVLASDQGKGTAQRESPAH